jgi:hypothetical protein
LEPLSELLLEVRDIRAGPGTSDAAEEEVEASEVVAEGPAAVPEKTRWRCLEPLPRAEREDLPREASDEVTDGPVGPCAGRLDLAPVEGTIESVDEVLRRWVGVPGRGTGLFGRALGEDGDDKTSQGRVLGDAGGEICMGEPGREELLLRRADGNGRSSVWW